MDVSIVVPIYNEFDNVPLLHDQLTNVMQHHDGDYELLFVDDGSRDGSLDRLREIALVDSHVKVIRFRRNYGQTAAMHAGIQHATGDVVITMDGDLQNDPEDIPMMLQKIEEGYDLVHGWRKNRQDALMNRKIPSQIANWLISKSTGFPIHDLGCTLKAIKTDIAQELELYGEMHRFIPILAHQQGAKCVEVVTKHHPRIHGVTKYGLGRTTRVILDLITVNFLLRYFNSPMKFFGKIGMWCAAIALVSAMTTLGMKLFGGVDMTGNPLLMQTVFSGMVSLQFLSLGIIGEVCARIYYVSAERRNYTIREVIQHPAKPLVRLADAA